MKQLSAFIAATVVTALVGLAILAIGLTAMVNPNALPANDTPAAGIISSVPAGAPSQQAGQLSSQLAQYQTQLDNAVQQLNQANAELQQDQAILAELQRRGIIRINADGSIQIRGAQR